MMTQQRNGDYIQVNSGRKFYVLDPRVEDIILPDIAHALSMICRFTGHGDRFYGVGEHSIDCARIARKLGYSPLIQLYCLLHDGSESIVNDLAKPVKQYIAQYKEIEDRIMKVIWEVAGLPVPTEEDYKIVKMIDNTMLINEMEQLMHRGDTPYDIEHEKMFVDLSVGYNAGESKEPFLQMFDALMEEYNEGDVDMNTVGVNQAIFKYELPHIVETLTLPKGSKILSAINQYQEPVVYALINLDEEENEEFEIIRMITGVSWLNGGNLEDYTFLDTLSSYNGSYIEHVFYRKLTKEVNKNEEANEQETSY